VEELLTASQTAALLQLHLRTIYKLARRGLIPGRKFGGGWRFSQSEILKMVAAGEDRESQDRERSKAKGGSR